MCPLAPVVNLTELPSCNKVGALLAAGVRSLSLYLLRVSDGAITWHGSVETGSLWDTEKRASLVRRMLQSLDV